MWGPCSTRRGADDDALSVITIASLSGSSTLFSGIEDEEGAPGPSGLRATDVSQQDEVPDTIPDNQLGLYGDYFDWSPFTSPRANDHGKYGREKDSA